MAQIVIAKRTGAWRLVYRDDGIDPVGFYWRNAGDPPSYSLASRDDVRTALQELVELANGATATG